MRAATPRTARPRIPQTMNTSSSLDNGGWNSVTKDGTNAGSNLQKKPDLPRERSMVFDLTSTTHGSLCIYNNIPPDDESV